MAVQIQMPKQREKETSMGRRLFAIAAPIVGGIFGGPVGAAAGGAIGAKVAGAEGSDAIMSGAQAGLGQMGSAPGVKQATDTLGQSKQLAGPTESAYSRRLQLSKENPAVAFNSGLEALPDLEARGLISPDQRKQYTGALVQGQMALGGRRNARFNY